jgi:hypothetical protein
MGLEPMTSPLPRECSTTELHQHCCQLQHLLARFQQLSPIYFSPVARARSVGLRWEHLSTVSQADPCHHDSKCEQPKQHPGQVLKLARLHRLPHQSRQHGEGSQRDRKTSAAPGAHIHSTLPAGKKNGAQGRIRTSVAHNAADLQSAAINHSATCASLTTSPATRHFALVSDPVADSRFESYGSWSERSGVSVCAPEPASSTTRSVQRSRLTRLGLAGSRLGRPKLELAKGFEPPTL